MKNKKIPAKPVFFYSQFYYYSLVYMSKRYYKIVKSTPSFEGNMNLHCIL